MGNSAHNRNPVGSALLRDELTRAIKKAALKEFADRGYRGFSMEAVAKRANVGKAALYRRWTGKDAMIVEVLADRGLQFANSPDTGSLRQDLIAYLHNTIAILRQPLHAKIAAHLYAEINSDSSFGKLARQRVHPAKRVLADGLLQRAIARGELDKNIDIDLAADVINGPLYWRLLVARGEADQDYFDRLVDFILAGFRAHPSRGAD